MTEVLIDVALAETLREWIEMDPVGLHETVEAIGNDGHTIWEPERFPAVPRHLLPHRVHHSEIGSPKTQIVGLHGAYIKVTGVWGLELSEALVNALGLEVPECLGRGFQCHANCDALREYLAALA